MLELEREVNTLRDEVAALTRSLKKAIATVKDLQGRVDDLVRSIVLTRLIEILILK